MTVMPYRRASASYPCVSDSNERSPAKYRLLKKQVAYCGFGSIRVTSRFAVAAKYLATVAPPTPPPITTTRAFAWLEAIRVRISNAAAVVYPNCRRVQRVIVVALSIVVGENMHAGGHLPIADGKIAAPASQWRCDHSTVR